MFNILKKETDKMDDTLKLLNLFDVMKEGF